MRDVTERPGMNKCRSSLQGLHEIRQQGILQQDGHGAGAAKFLSTDHLSALSQADQNSPEALAKICMVGRQGQHRHDFRRLRNHKLPRPPPGFLSQENVAKRAVTHPKRAWPSDPFRIDLERISVEQMVIDKCGKEIVARRNGMRIAGKMQIDIFHRVDLGSPASGTAPLDSEDRSQGRLPERDGGPMA